MNIRSAEGGDTDAIADVFLSALSGMTYLPQLYTDAETRDFVRDVLIPNNEVWVAEDSGRVVGFAGFGDGFLRHLWVHRPDQNRGVAPSS